MTHLEGNRFEHLSDPEQHAAFAFVSRMRRQFDGRLLSAILFGSRARGEAEPDSDMDVLVVLSTVDWHVRKQVRHLAVDVWLEYGIYPSTRVWSLEDWRAAERMRTGLFQGIQRDGIDLLRPPAG